MDAEAKETGNGGCQKCGRCFTVKEDGHKLAEVEGDTKPSIGEDKLIEIKDEAIEKKDSFIGKKGEPGERDNDKRVIEEDRANVVDKKDSNETSS